MEPMVPARLVKLIVCPYCHSTLRFNADFTSLRCTGCDRRFRVEDEIPVLLIQDSVKPAGKE
jgi:uncharacterized protein YbaR (Trm112 family)